MTHRPAITPLAATARACPALVLALALAAAPAWAKRKAEAPVLPTDDRGRYEFLCARVAASWDTTRGGFVSKDGVPSESAVALALLLGRDDAHREWRDRALETIDWTRGLLDTLGGGYYTRRAENGAAPETFSMRTDVNARRLVNLLVAWRTTGDERYLRDAKRVAGFVDRVLIDGRGGFVAAPVGDRNLEPAANGAAIHAWLTWAASSGDTRNRDFVNRSIERVWESCFDPKGVLLRRGDFGEVVMAPQLLDQVEMGRALVLSSALCGRPQDLKRAIGLGMIVIEKFTDPKEGGFMTQAMPKKDGSIRRAPVRARENARAALFFAELAAATGSDVYRVAARSAWEAAAKDQDEWGLDAADWALAFRAVLTPERPVSPVWQAAAEPPTGPAIIFRTHRSSKR